MTRDEFISTRKTMGLTQTGLAEKLGMSLRQIQGLENGTTELRLVHTLAIERVALSHAATTLALCSAPRSVENDVMCIVAHFQGKGTE